MEIFSLSFAYSSPKEGANMIGNSLLLKGALLGLNSKNKTKKTKQNTGPTFSFNESVDPLVPCH